MATIPRLGVALVAVALSLFAMGHELARLRLYRSLATLERESAALLLRSDTQAARINARNGLERARQLSRRFPANVDLPMIAAVHCRSLGRPLEAASWYEKALAIERRPEIFLNLGTMRLEAGEKAKAIEAFTKAAEYDPLYLKHIPVSSVQPEVFAAVRTAWHRGKALLTNGDFEEEIHVRSTLVPPGRVSRVIARGWIAHNRGSGRMSVDLARRTKRGTSKMLHVEASSQLSAALQRFHPAEIAPARARFAAEVFVLRGEVALGVGTHGTLIPSEIATADGKWHRLEIVNEECPVVDVGIVALSDEAEFYVDNASLTELPGRCDPTTNRLVEE